MDKEHRVSVYDMVKELNLKEVTPEINSKEVYIEQAGTQSQGSKVVRRL